MTTTTQKRNIFKCLSVGTKTKGNPSVRKSTQRKKSELQISVKATFLLWEFAMPRNLKSWFSRAA